MNYFAYGSNMSASRLKERVPSAFSLGCYRLNEHDLRYHKISIDGSGKCDAYFTSGPDDAIYGVLFEIDANEKSVLDRIEGLGKGYEEKEIILTALDGSLINATTYVASKIDESLKPYSWYLNHVFIGAREASLPSEYVDLKINSIEFMDDKNRERDTKQRAIYS